MISIDRPSAGRTIAGWVIIGITLLFFILLILVPLVQQFIISFQKWNFMGNSQSVGLANYTRLIEDDRFLTILGNTLAAPGFYLRALFLMTVSLALGLLFMELRNGGRVALQILIAPLILFSGALVTAFVYFMYYSPMGGLAQALTPAPEGGPIAFLADPERSAGILGNFLLAVGLAFALPFGTAFFTSAGRGARTLGDGAAYSFGGFWARTWRIIVASAFGAIGFSFLSLESAYALPLPLLGGDNLLTYAFRISFQRFNLGEGAAILQFLVWPLLAIGLACVLFLEAGRSQISIRVVPRLKEKITAGAAWSAGRVIMVIAAGVVAVILIVLLIIVIGLPWLGSILGFTQPLGGTGEEIMSQGWASLASSLGSAFLVALLGWAFAAAAGLAFGYWQPRGSRWLLKVLGVFMFIGPALLFISHYLMLRNLGLLGTPLALVIPGMISPLLILLFSWFFRGARNEKTAAGAGAYPAGRVWARFFLFSIPVIAALMLISMNATLLPLTMLNGPKTFTMPLFLMMVRGGQTMLGMRSQALLVQLSFLQYLVPLVLLVISAIVVFPRLALVVRRKGEAAAKGIDGESGD